MCGIIGYISNKNNTNIAKLLLDILKGLEYRGYDSSGIVYYDKHSNNSSSFKRYRSVGNISKLKMMINSDKDNNISSFNNCINIGIGHTRWATHGKVTVENTHPHETNDLYIVHNGIIENYLELKDLINSSNKDIVYQSQTDTEILGYWLSFNIINNNINNITSKNVGNKQQDIVKSISQALKYVRGTYGLCIINKNCSNTLIAIRKGSPLCLGIKDNKDNKVNNSNKEYFICSDAIAISSYVDKIIHLEDDEMVICTPENYKIYNIKTSNIKEGGNRLEKVEKNEIYINNKDYEHILLKEINDQPQAMNNLLAGKINHDISKIVLGGLSESFISNDFIKSLENILLIGCGSAYYAALTAKYVIESVIPLNIQVELASEYRYRNTYVPKNSIAIFISQSGETADTLASLSHLQDKDIQTFGIINSVGSTIARKVQSGIYLHAGPEKSVASTKAFTNQVIAIYLLCIGLVQHKLSIVDRKSLINGLSDLSNNVSNLLNKQYDIINELSKEFVEYKNALYLSRGHLYPIALEGALKLKELAYIHAEGFSASELKHGPIALIDDNYFIVFLLVKGDLYEKAYSNLEQVLSRRSNGSKKNILIITDNDKFVEIPNTHTIHINNQNKDINQHNKLQQVISFNIVLQLLSYCIAKHKGCNVDQPRFLAKSVTVE